MAEGGKLQQRTSSRSYRAMNATMISQASLETRQPCLRANPLGETTRLRKERQQEAEDRNDAVRKHIEARAITMLERCNNLVGDKVTRDYVAPSFRATHDGLPTA
ncbi:hypothetical protein LTR33_001556 [Friedmanniomyces endolithicus]|nr:hypothetical protein LTR33_001556 [Friedmanniomyces endolithicus]